MKKPIDIKFLKEDAFNMVRNSIRTKSNPIAVRATTQQWKAMLLANADSFICEGRLVKLITASLGFGVLEVTYIIP